MSCWCSPPSPSPPPLSPPSLLCLFQVTPRPEQSCLPPPILFRWWYITTIQIGPNWWGKSLAKMHFSLTPHPAISEVVATHLICKCQLLQPRRETGFVTWQKMRRGICFWFMFQSNICPSLRCMTLKCGARLSSRSAPLACSSPSLSLLVPLANPC